MSCRSRYGSFFKGFSKLINIYNKIKTPEAPTDVNITSAQDFSYVYSQGIWDLTSTTQFPKVSGSGSINLGLTAPLLSLTGASSVFTSQNIDISSYAGRTVRLVIQGINGGGYSCDYQIDQIDFDGNVYGFENETHGFETSTADIATYDNVTWSSVAVEQGNTGRWQVDSGGTPSGTTAETTIVNGSFYIYNEASSPADQNGFNFWLRSPEVTLSSNPTLTISEARDGDNIGTLNVYLEVIA